MKPIHKDITIAVIVLCIVFTLGLMGGMSVSKGSEYDHGYYDGQLDASHGRWMSIKLFRDYQGMVPEWIKGE